MTVLFYSVSDGIQGLAMHVAREELSVVRQEILSEFHENQREMQDKIWELSSQLRDLKWEISSDTRDTKWALSSEIRELKNRVQGLK